MKLNICHIYPTMLNLYGDSGNVKCLEKRCKQKGIDVSVFNFDMNESFDFEFFDVFFIGGGQDFDQEALMKDLNKTKKSQIISAINRNKTILAVCGGFQLLGNSYETENGNKIKCLGALNFETKKNKKRMIGNVAFKTKEGIEICGFENHSGKTVLGKGLEPLGKIIKGFGNNGKDGFEGVRFKNTFGTYCHGPVLPKNPVFADLIISTAISNRYGECSLEKTTDFLENKAHNFFMKNYIFNSKFRK